MTYLLNCDHPKTLKQTLINVLIGPDILLFINSLRLKMKYNIAGYYGYYTLFTIFQCGIVLII